MKLTNKLIITCLMAVVSIGATAQSAREVLDMTAARLTQKGCIKATFKATQFNGLTESGSAKGTMWMSGRKFKMDTSDMVTWFNGQTEWTMLKGSNEVNVSQPTEAEQQAINPYTFINIYKKGYRLSVKKGSLRGKDTFVVTMRAKRQRAISHVIIDVDSHTYAPLCIRALRDGNWTRLSILSFTGEPASESIFTFPAADYPNAEIIDLR